MSIILFEMYSVLFYILSENTCYTYNSILLLRILHLHLSLDYTIQYLNHIFAMHVFQLTMLSSLVYSHRDYWRMPELLVYCLSISILQELKRLYTLWHGCMVKSGYVSYAVYKRIVSLIASSEQTRPDELQLYCSLKLGCCFDILEPDTEGMR